MPRRFEVDRLAVEVHVTRREMGAAAARRAAGILRTAIEQDGKAALVLAAAPSQNEFLEALCAQPEVDWRCVTAFHMDEYAEIRAEHPASFRNYLRERIAERVTLAAFHEIRGDAADLDVECERYANLLSAAQPVLVAMGIGENGHLAFIDPDECNFSDPRDVRIVNLDQACRAQQVHDGCFGRIEDVPRRAISLTIPFFLRVPHAVVCVPGERKRDAVRAALSGPVEERCPASALRRHPDATLFLDADAAGLL